MQGKEVPSGRSDSTARNLENGQRERERTDLVYDKTDATEQMSQNWCQVSKQILEKMTSENNRFFPKSRRHSKCVNLGLEKGIVKGLIRRLKMGGVWWGTIWFSDTGEEKTIGETGWQNHNYGSVLHCYWGDDFMLRNFLILMKVKKSTTMPVGL